MAKKLSKFERGYICAVSNLIAGHGANTDAWDTFCAMGRTLSEVLSLKDLDNFDRDNISELISFDPSMSGANK